ncbi:Asp23/Gls24 family envelope stress response protein [Brachybacterium sp. AOP3-A1-3]|uniref:Asp23/Gls24 family envelope stress response protein n=1 Tax=Brachybacterium sp. AOP3-A1-3 TaxID=3457699 RepID=UPI0040346F25
MSAVHGTTAPATELEDRGTTTFPAQVVARIAEQVASEVPHIGSDAGGVLGVGARRDFASRPSARCDVYGRTAVLTLDVGVDFPSPLAPALGALREHVRERVEHLTGLEVGRLDVTISWLNPATPARRALR